MINYLQRRMALNGVRLYADDNASYTSAFTTHPELRHAVVPLPFVTSTFIMYSCEAQWFPFLFFSCCCRPTRRLIECDRDSAVTQPYRRAATKQFHIVTKSWLLFQRKQQEAGPTCLLPLPPNRNATQWMCTCIQNMIFAHTV